MSQLRCGRCGKHSYMTTHGRCKTNVIRNLREGDQAGEEIQICFPFHGKWKEQSALLWVIYYPPVAVMGFFKGFIISNTCQVLKPGPTWRHLSLGASVHFCSVWHIPVWMVDRTHALWDTPPWISKTMNDIPKSSREQKEQGSGPDHLLQQVVLHCPSPCLCHLQKTLQRPETVLKENTADVPVLSASSPGLFSRTTQLAK